MKEKIIKPVRDGYITSTFDEVRGNKIHGGYDIGCKQHPCYIHSICDSIVIASGYSQSFGWRVWASPTDEELKQKYPYIIYAHLAQHPIVKTFSKIEKGTIIGIMGNTGISRGVHLHLEARTKPDLSGKSIRIDEIEEFYGIAKPKNK